MLKGIALVTGASRGIGRSIALRLSRDGFKLALNDLPSSKGLLEEVQSQIIKNGGQAMTVPGDVSVEKDVESMVGNVAETYGGLDVMVANAGIALVAPLLESTTQEFERVLSVNVIGVYHCYKYAALQMVKQGRGGRIIGASSVAGKQAWPFISFYSASKFAIRGLTQSAALELGKHGITVNAYAPGGVKTPMLEGIAKDLGHIANSGFSTSDGSLAIGTANGRHTTPEEIANLVAFLASKESEAITGQTVSINGGLYFD
ncbi:hypothetical protein NLJ89_g11712 [Agrocybe chaxingu]|uniref:3-oxoacyl-[acyl-carrier-protein] reductase n=1 Tax=Agrocybe chaxingu TaxID=84603 RepID=A0A9W8MP51_9AGAR|nr:hypothetical protein NLJ89_g11712 [Agrocybe chaxingu]